MSIIKKTNDTDRNEKLSAELDAILNEIEATTKDSKEKLDRIEADIDAEITNLEKNFSELDALEKDTSDKLDTLILEQTEDDEKE